MSPVPFELAEIDSLAAQLPAYEFDGVIARGGMGVVYKARQRSLDRDVAVKILLRELGDDPVFRDSFQAEARAMARLSHPNLIRVYDSGNLDGLLYIVMEYVPCKSLYHSAHGKVIDAKQAVGFIIAACDGLAHAHANGIIHRDIKPANILLTPACEPKIGDFGLARCTRSGADGLAMGTPAYMAPEVVRNPETGSPRSDVFALGVVLQELLTGIPAGSEKSGKPVLPDLKLAAICRKATHPDGALRYPDAASFRDGLARWLAAATDRPTPRPRPAAPHQPKPAVHRPRPAASLRHPKPRNRTLLKTCAVITFLLVSIHFSAGVYQTKREDPARIGQAEPARPATAMIGKPESPAAARPAPPRRSPDPLPPSIVHQEH